MTSVGYAVERDPYVYKGSQCLKNRLGLRDPARLAAFELEISSLRAEEPLPSGHFGAAHYRRVHWHLFRDVYQWAGRYRTVRTGKGGNWFCYPEYIDGQMETLFRRLKSSAFQPGAAEADFLDAATLFLADLNAIHPFREGNGRAQLAFLDLLAYRAGRPFDFSRVRKVEFLDAMIASFTGTSDPLKHELARLRTP